MDRRRALTAMIGAAASGAGAAAGREIVRVIGTTDLVQAQPLIDDFERRHPDLAIDYHDVVSREVMNRVIADAVLPDPRIDVAWSSAMDLQVKLVNDGYALRHASPHAAALPRWAVWKHEAYGTTFEPLAMAWNRDEGPPPRTRAELLRLLTERAGAWRDRVVTYDVGRAGLGYLLAAHEADDAPDYWSLISAFGAVRARLFDRTQSMLERVAAGDVLAYHVLSSYAQRFAAAHPRVQVVHFTDYSFVVSRVAFIARRAPNPAGARAWLDYLLSRAGQSVLAGRSGLYALRDDIEAARTAAGVQLELGSSARPIALAPGLLAYLDRNRQAAFVQQWQRVYEHGR